MQTNTSFHTMPSIIFMLIIIFSLTACSEEDKNALTTLNNLSKAADKINTMEDSKFEQNCINKINNATETGDYEKMTANNQVVMTKIFNECIAALNKELSLTEKDFENSDENKSCYKGIKEIRNGVAIIETKIQEFTSMPNNTEQDATEVAITSATVGAELMMHGGAAMLNRTMTCAMGLK